MNERLRHAVQRMGVIVFASTALTATVGAVGNATELHPPVSVQQPSSDVAAKARPAKTAGHLAWGNWGNGWHNWGNGWHNWGNGWHNWHNWHNWNNGVWLNVHV